MADRDQIAGFGSADAWMRAWRLASGAVRRRWISIAMMTALFAATGAAAAVLLPRTYAAESRLLAQRNYVMPALAHPRRAVPTGADSPTQSAVEFVLNRPALEGIVRRIDLVGRWDRERPAVLRFKDRVTQRVRGPITDEDKLDAIVDLLAKRISVSVINDTITVKATWSDPRTVVDIVTGAVEAFLEARRKMDVQAIADTHALLSRTAETERANVEAQLAVVAAVARTAAVERPRQGAPVVRSTLTPKAPIESRDTDPLDGLRSQILDARTEIASGEARHEQQIREAESRLAQSRAVQTDRHPDVLALQRALGRLREEPSALRAARANEAQLVAQYVASGGRLDRLSTSGAGAANAADADAAVSSSLTDAVLARQARAGDEDPDAVVYARSLLKSSVETYQDILTRLANAQIELETAKAAFGYRYAVSDPARLPKKASAPNVPFIVVGALLAGLFAGVVRALFNELRARALLSPSALVRHLSMTAPLADPT